MFNATELFVLGEGFISGTQLLRQLLFNKLFRVDDESKFILDNLGVLPIRRREVQPVRVMVKDIISDPEDYYYGILINTASKGRLNVFPTDGGPRVRLAYDNQPENEALNIAMDPVLVKKTGKTVIFCLYALSTTQLHLNHVVMGPQTKLKPDSEFLFWRYRI